MNFLLLAQRMVILPLLFHLFFSRVRTNLRTFLRTFLLNSVIKIIGYPCFPLSVQSRPK